MSITTSYTKRIKGEKQVEDLEMDTIQWDTRLQYSTEEINFLMKFLSSDIFSEEISGLNDSLEKFQKDLNDLRLKKIDLQVALHNHRNDLLGMRECEDISCELFYNSQHQELIDNIQEHFTKFQELKSKIFRFASPKLKQQHEEGIS